jgi:hypothetical protein
LIIFLASHGKSASLLKPNASHKRKRKEIEEVKEEEEKFN